MANIRPIQSQDKPVVRPVLERKAGVKVFDAPVKVEKSTELGDSETPITPVNTASKATIIYKSDIEPEDIEVTSGDGEGAKPSEEKVENTNDVLPEKFKGKSMQDVVKSYTELESLTTRLAQKNMELEKSYAKPANEIPEDVELPDNYSDLMLDNPAEAKRILQKAISTAVAKELNKAKAESASVGEEEDKTNALKFVMIEYPEYYSSDHSNTVNALAMSYPSGTYTERYKKACEDYSKLRQDARVEVKKEVQKEIKDVEQMKESAIIPGTTPKKVEKKKYIKRSEINHLIVSNPGMYAKRIDEIRTAVREGRILEDA